MKPTKGRTDIPVLMLYNVNPAWEPDETAAAMDGVERLMTGLRAEGHPVVGVPVADEGLSLALHPYHPDDYVILNWCEELPGRTHSDVSVAEILEELNFSYTGPSAQALDFSWDKAAVKALLLERGIPTPFGRVIEAGQVDQWDRFPAIVKPVREHCSFGITSEAVVGDRRELRERIAFVEKHFRQPALVEDFIDGREFHVTLWGNGEVHVLPVAEMDFSAFDNFRDRLCTFDSKFTPGSPHYEKIELRLPALLDESELTCLNRTVIDAYRAAGCRDYARMDLRSQDGCFYILDINPNPDLSPDTSLVYAAEAAGYSYGALASRLIHLAAQRHPVFSRWS
jgi:D-alanine-D-alanine ligase